MSATGVFLQLNIMKSVLAAISVSYIFGEHSNVTFHRHIKRNIA